MSVLSIEPGRAVAALVSFDSQLDLAAALGLSEEQLYVYRSVRGRTNDDVIRTLLVLADVVNDLDVLLVQPEEGSRGDVRQQLFADVKSFPQLPGHVSLRGVVHCKD